MGKMRLREKLLCNIQNDKTLFAVIARSEATKQSQRERKIASSRQFGTRNDELLETVIARNEVTKQSKKGEILHRPEKLGLTMKKDPTMLLRWQNLKRSYNFFSLIIFLTLSLFIVACSSDTKTTPTETAGTPVKVANPAETSLIDYMSFNANTVFMKKEIVRSTFQGFIQKVYKNIGDYVNAGDVVFQVITKEAYATDSLQVKLSDEVFSGIVNIKSKTSGVLTELNFNVGDFVSDGEQLAVISNPNSLAVLLNVPYQHISKIRLNSSCILVFPNGKEIKGIVSKSLPSVDPVSQTQTFLIDFVDGKNIPANLNLEVKIPVNVIKNAIVVPKSAVQSDETLTNFWIMKLINDSTAVKTIITKGIENDTLVQIINPKLLLTDKIIVDGAYGLPDTAKVVVRH
ncbi:RND family efflux transporter protein [Ignavibacterium album JCM 16511]|uniref:RND family efflux transporter protein n=1 Tax=Ignavibacterium album (strain DSM 19864 / JCM 16511 / NBRC 101810 / Mat9-16) TaxID=945713 RepID=I0AFY0_IGNAJ|nr:HlyD family efflux transporter periplasmic adaptor subunit [Ignavibacterium album]AFH47887.1 RND family efflux transporter protein [Ignavibacterium album JCM 16511]